MKWWLRQSLAIGLMSTMAMAADDASKRLDDLNRSIQNARSVTERSGRTIEELRKDLFQVAVSTRDAKRLSEEVERALKSGDVNQADLNQLKLDILNSTTRLRDLNAHITQLTSLLDDQQSSLRDLDNEIRTIKKTVATADASVASLKAELAEARAENERSKKNIAALSKESRSVMAGEAAAATLNKISESLATSMSLLAGGKIDEAADGFSQLLDMHPDIVEAKLGLASCHFENGDLEGSRAIIADVLQVEKNNPWALGIQGAIAYREGKLREARKTLEKAVKLDEANPYNLNYLAVALFESGRTEAAFEAMRKAIELDPNYISALHNYAVMLLTAKTPDVVQALAYYKKTLSLGAPRDPAMDQWFGLP